MPRKREKYRAGRTVKTSISLSETVNSWAEVLATKQGYDNFSAYIAELIRRDKKRDEGEAGTAGAANPKTPEPDTSAFALNEPRKPRIPKP